LKQSGLNCPWYLPEVHKNPFSDVQICSIEEDSNAGRFLEYNQFKSDGIGRSRCHACESSWRRNM